MTQSFKAEQKHREERERAEAERKRNSPEEIERRRLEQERIRAELEERERQRKAQEEFAAREKWAHYHRYPRFDEIDAMDGIQFEFFVKDLLERNAFSQVRTTSQSGDQGADLVGLTPPPEHKKVVVQTKRGSEQLGTARFRRYLARCSSTVRR